MHNFLTSIIYNNNNNDNNNNRNNVQRYKTYGITKYLINIKLAIQVRLGTCKTGLSPPVTLCYWSFQVDTSVVVLFVLCLCV